MVTDAEVIAKLKEKNSRYKNQDPSVVATQKFGQVTVYTLEFIGEDNKRYINYVTEVKNKLDSHRYIDEVINVVEKIY